MRVWAGIAGVLLALAAPGSAAAGEESPEAEYAALQKAYGEARNAWMAPYREAKTDAERGKVRLDPEKNPDREYLGKFLDLARRAKGSDAGVRAAGWVVGTGSRGTDGKKQAEEALDLALTSGLGSPALAELAQSLRYAAWGLGEEKVVAALRTIGEKAAVPDARAAGLFGLAALWTEGQDEARKKEARAIFGRLLEEFPTSPAAKQAKGYVNELERLQVGCTAPDFEATDGDGVKFKLSDYRGKVVLLDFWGFW